MATYTWTQIGSLLLALALLAAAVYQLVVKYNADISQVLFMPREQGVGVLNGAIIALALSLFAISILSR